MKKLIAFGLAVAFLVGPLIVVLKRPSEPVGVALARMPQRLRQVTGQEISWTLVEERKRLAQQLCSVYSAGFASGVPWRGSTKNELIQDVLSGRPSENGPWKERVFRFICPSDGNVRGNVNAWDWSEIARFIKLRESGEGRVLDYDPYGSEPPEPSLAGAGLDSAEFKSSR
jgi:hypothetical protein